MKLRNAIIIGVIYTPSICQAVEQTNYKYYSDHISINQDSSTIVKPNEINPKQAEILIAPKNSKGISHNKYDTFDVTDAGIILNNKEVAAETIINEVVNGATSFLAGNIAVAGNAAHVVIANPNGIECHNCSFSNTLSETLVTGKPIIDNDELIGYRLETSISSLDKRAFGGKPIDHIGKIVFSNKDNRSSERPFNKINIISNNIKLENGFISSKKDIIIHSGKEEVIIKEGESILKQEYAMRSHIKRDNLPSQIILGDKNGDPKKQGLISSKNIIINASDTTIYNYGSLESSNRSKNAIQLNLNKTIFNNHGYILARGGYLDLKNGSFFHNMESGTIGMPYWLNTGKTNNIYSGIYIGLIPKDTISRMKNLTLNISEDSNLINDGIIMTERLHTRDKNISNIQNNREDVQFYIKLLKIK
ncbi:filamentous hemagglutinin N-terminal domain-containing protein [Proteus mirabilis]|uniref:two-partner secretion domain-containing protein n=1 Tax=Proteus mirabilis TaxID=584 RepID=UPI0011ECE8AE|nr:filamentous hemagglutinin N-terminal domain-containing protein [Proteus mirabilis]EKU2833007.1 filamentous hemagglutinin N-terminal domain-containing protein [Proteus mirabilis]EKU2834022.1 filamentous hemagglutinin N-terminal domain-containing protein [Proteus mirabilis]MBB6689483.1 filamentous hemagglutinin N-terminal domain-containing protein [Proteus mirabilis]MBG2743723.1 filamentous hemagglutinin N-terminal domain-containing protein [Proteus mirabilis]MBG5965102.1 filamentous hemagglu